MKKTFALIISIICLFGFSVKLKAQCTGGRYHDLIFPENPVVTSNIVYGSNLDQNGATVSLKLDIYEPACDVATNRPLIIFAHGGGFVAGDKTDAGYVQAAVGLAKLGYVVASINYRLGFPTSGLPAQYGFNSAIMRGLHDGRAAVRFMRNNALNGGNTYKIDPTNIYFSGASAGAIIALHLAYENLQSEMTLSCGGQPGTDQSSIEGNSNSLAVSSSVKAIIAVSGGIRSLSWITTNDIPACLAHGTVDQTVPYGSGSFGGFFAIEGSSTIAARCNTTGTTYCFKPMYGQDHVPANPAYPDTLATITRNFLEKFVCSTALNCNYTSSPVAMGPAVSIVNTTGSNTICQGTSVTFTATAVNASAPTFQWKVNGTNTGPAISTFTTTTLATGSIVTCTITPSCGSQATSSGITITVTPNPTITQNGNTLTSSSSSANQWYLNGSIISGAINQTYTATQSGSYTVKVGLCISQAINLTTTNITDHDKNDFSFSVYPSPNNGNFHISFNSINRESYIIEVKNIKGDLVYHELVSSFTGLYSKHLDISKYGKGIYLIQLNNSKTEVVKKIVVD